jgi:hypothetical protein
MTREMAYQAMLEGEKIHHRYFSSNEYLRIKNGVILSEEGYNFNEWWEERNDREEWIGWSDGWEVIE